jgi:hypothetical protein
LVFVSIVGSWDRNRVLIVSTFRSFRSIDPRQEKKESSDFKISRALQSRFPCSPLLSQSEQIKTTKISSRACEADASLARVLPSRSQPPAPAGHHGSHARCLSGPTQVWRSSSLLAPYHGGCLAPGNPVHRSPWHIRALWLDAPDRLPTPAL